MQKLYLRVGDELVEYKEVSQAEEDSTRRLVDAGVSAISSLIAKLKPRPPYDVRRTNWYPLYFQTNVKQINNCITKKRASGSVEWREKLFGSLVTWFSDAPGSAAPEIVLLGVAPPSHDNVATIREFQALDEDCQQAQRDGKIPEDAHLTFSRVPERLLATRIESELRQGRCVIIASCHEDQRHAVEQVYDQFVKTTSEKETVQFTVLERDFARPLPSESRWWR